MFNLDHFFSLFNLDHFFSLFNLDRFFLQYRMLTDRFFKLEN